MRLPNTHAMNVSRDLAFLFYSIGTDLSFDMGKHIFELIVSHAESETTNGKLPFPSLIFEVLSLQKTVKEDPEALESLPGPSRYLRSYLQVNMWWMYR